MAPMIEFVNHVLGQHAWARERLRAHAGKTVRIDALPLVLTLKISAAGEVESAPRVENADVAFRVNAAQIPLMLADPEGALKSVHLTGDADFAQVVASLLRELRWDVEEDLSRFVGDVPAYRMMKVARSFAAWGRDASQRLAGTTAAFLVDEEPLLVRGAMAEQLAAGVAEARDALARLEKRIEMLEADRQAKSAS